MFHENEEVAVKESGGMEDGGGGGYRFLVKKEGKGREKGLGRKGGRRRSSGERNKVGTRVIPVFLAGAFPQTVYPVGGNQSLRHWKRDGTFYLLNDLIETLHTGVKGSEAENGWMFVL